MRNYPWALALLAEETLIRSLPLPVLNSLAKLTQNIWRAASLGGKLGASQPDYLPTLVAVMTADNPAFVSLNAADTRSALCSLFFRQ